MEEENEETVEQFSEPGRYNSSNCPFRKKKKLLREQRKQRERVELKMDLPGVSIADEGETGMFSLRTIRGHQVRGGWNSVRTRGSVCVFGRGSGIKHFLSVLHDHCSWLLCPPMNMTR